jgi:hypothetical protein
MALVALAVDDNFFHHPIGKTELSAYILMYGKWLLKGSPG